MEALQVLKKQLCPKTLHVHLTRLSEKMLREYNIKRDRDNGTSKEERGRKRSREEEHKKRSRISWEDREEERQRLEKKLNMSQMKEGDKNKSSDDGNYRGDQNSTTSGSSGPASLTFSSFNFHREIGRGAFGKVILATLKKSPKSVIALKIIRKKKDENPQSLENERRVLVTATGSAFLCGALAAFQTQGHVCFIMEYLSGGSLEHHMTMRRFLDLDTVLFYAAEMVCGLQYLHDRGIVHRDIKLDNVLLDNRGHIQIADFGLAAVNVSAGQTISDRAGTLYYLAPEIILRRNYNAAVDWWSFGIVVCRMATGKSPFYSGVKVQEVIRSIVKDQPRFVRGLSEVFYDLMNKLLDKQPHCRLGATGDIRAHPFFAAINWVDLEECRLSPPFQPSFPIFEDQPTEQNISFLNTTETNDDYHPVPDFTFISPKWTY